MGKRKQSRISRPQKAKSKRISPPNDKDGKPKGLVFSLKHIQPGKHCFSSLDKEQKAAFADSIFRRKDFSVVDLINSDRHGLGCEKIPIRQVKYPRPAIVTEDEDFYQAVRFKAKAPMVGFIQDNVFYVLWFDHDFKVYSH